MSDRHVEQKLLSSSCLLLRDLRALRVANSPRPPRIKKAAPTQMYPFISRVGAAGVSLVRNDTPKQQTGVVRCLPVFGQRGDDVAVSSLMK